MTEYDADANPVVVVDPNGHATTFSYNDFSQPLSIEDELGGRVRFSYDARGNLLTLTDPDGGQRINTYNADGTVSSSKDLVHPPALYTYTSEGWLQTITNGNGGLTVLSHDLNGRVVAENRADGSVTRGYDAAGRQTDLTDLSGHTHWNLDPLGRPTQVTSPQGNITYTYSGSQRTSMVTPSASFAYEYDGGGRLSQVDGPAGVIDLTYTYGGIHQVIRANGVTTTSTYDLGGRLTDIVHADPAGPLAEFHYTLDAKGNRTALQQMVDGDDWTETYEFDATDRLIGVHYGDTGQTTSYTYSLSGDRTSMTVANAPLGNGTTSYEYDSAHQLVSYVGPDGPRTIEYDGNGNQVYDGEGSSLSFDSMNQLVGISGTMGSHSYLFNGDGVRVGQDGANQLWDQTAGLPLLVDDGTSTQTYAGGQLLAQSADGVSTTVLSDALGSTRLAVDDQGETIATARFDVYGAPRGTDGLQSAFGFGGQQTDETGLINLRARMYQPRTGQFLSEDPLLGSAALSTGGRGLAATFMVNAMPCGGGGANFASRAYASNRPTTLGDPSGLAPWNEPWQWDAHDLMSECFLACESTRDIHDPPFECLEDCRKYVEEVGTVVIGGLIALYAIRTLPSLFALSTSTQIAYGI